MSWDWQVFCEDTITREATQSCFGQGGDITYLDWLLSAWGWTVSVSLLALLLALLVGAVVGTLRTLPNRPLVVRAGNAWVELFRNIPLLVQIFLWYHVLPALLPVVLASMLVAPYGARLAHRLPVATLRRVFAVVLWLLAAKMVWSYA